MALDLGTILLLLPVWNNPILFSLDSLSHAADFTKSKIQTLFWSLSVLHLVPNVCSLSVHWVFWYFLLLHPLAPVCSSVEAPEPPTGCQSQSSFGHFYKLGTIYFTHFIQWFCSLVFHWVPPQQSLNNSCWSHIADFYFPCLERKGITFLQVINIKCWHVLQFKHKF